MRTPSCCSTFWRGTTPSRQPSLGVEGHDTGIFDLKPGYDTRFEADLASVATQLEGKLATEKDTHVQQDLHILIDAAVDNRTTSEMNRRLMLPYFDLPQALFQGFQSLLDPRVSKDRYPAALIRLRKYTGREPGYTPITQLARERAEERFGVEGLTGPWTVEVEQNLENEPRYVSGIRDLFKESGLTGWQADLELLEQQLAEHSRWVRSAILPRARKTNRLPPEIYADNLRNFGVDADPRALIDQAVLSFVETRDEMQTIAGLVAKERGYKSSDYRDVLRELKKDKIAKDQLLDDLPGPTLEHRGHRPPREPAVAAGTRRRHSAGQRGRVGRHPGAPP